MVLAKARSVSRTCAASASLDSGGAARAPAANRRRQETNPEDLRITAPPKRDTAIIDAFPRGRAPCPGRPEQARALACAPAQTAAIFAGMKIKSLTFAFLLLAVTVFAADAPPAPQLEQVTPRVSVIVAGFNGIITLFRSDAGPVIVDTANAEYAPQVQAVIRTFDPRPPAAVILTHYHDDHTGGLAVIAAGATVYAHETCLAT